MRGIPTAKRYEAGGYRTDTLYCGNSDYGYRHLEQHIGARRNNEANGTGSDVTQVIGTKCELVLQP